MRHWRGSSSPSASWDAGYDLSVIVISISTVHQARSHASHPPLLVNDELAAAASTHIGALDGGVEGSQRQCWPLRPRSLRLIYQC